MANMTAALQSFIELMKKSEDHERKGFEVLLARPGSEKLFDTLSLAGFFDAARSPGIVPAEEPNSYRVPYWTVLDYLHASAKAADERKDLDLAEEVMNVVRAV